ncbi:MAG: polyprenyl synthetase family protein [Eubacterium sp.]|nr:polyprenyl synthetase family protein [Eubacterium sp.]
MDIVTIKKEMEERTAQIEQVLEKYIPKEEGPQKIIIEALRYSLLSGGKRLRPMLMLETYRMFGGQETVIEPFLAAIEMIHTYSLIHDDLPAMDDDAYRRGRKTTHVVYGEAMGILAGDALLNLAFETAAKAFMLDMQTEQTEQQFLADMQISRKPLYEQERMRRVAQAMQILAKKAGIYGMLGGQVVDVQNEDHQQIDGETLDFIYQMKTGALIEAAMTIGAVLAGADSQEVSLLEQAARRVGVAFQIQDDILDVTSTLEELGKPVGSDEKNEKNTYVTMYGMEAAKKQVEALTQEAARCMEQLTVTNSFLNDLLLYLIRRRS